MRLKTSLRSEAVQARNVIERFGGSFKRCRRIAIHSRNQVVNFTAFCWLAVFITAGI